MENWNSRWGGKGRASLKAAAAAEARKVWNAEGQKRLLGCLVSFFRPTEAVAAVITTSQRTQQNILYEWWKAIAVVVIVVATVIRRLIWSYINKFYSSCVSQILQVKKSIGFKGNALFASMDPHQLLGVLPRTIILAREQFIYCFFNECIRKEKKNTLTAEGLVIIFILW